MPANNPNQGLVLQTAATDSAPFALVIQDMTSRLLQAAAAEVDAAVGEGAYTELERRAMTMTEALRLTSGMELGTILTRGELIRAIEREGLASVHPNGYANLTDLATQNNISVSELSDTRALCDVIFPYITDVLGRSLPEVWSGIGKSALREMVPAIKAMITGETPAHGSVRTAVETMLNQAAAELIADGTFDQETMQSTNANTRAQVTAAVRERAVETLLHNGATLTSREFRRTIRPTGTPPVEMAMLEVADHQWYAVLKVDSQQKRDMVVRLLGTHVNSMTLNGRGAETRSHRRTLGSFFGDVDE